MECNFLECKQNVSAGINTLISISDGLGLYIFCQKMEKARPMREEMDGNVVFFPPESAFLTLMLYFKKYFSLNFPNNPQTLLPTEPNQPDTTVETRTLQKLVLLVEKTARTNRKQAN